MLKLMHLPLPDFRRRLTEPLSAHQRASRPALSPTRSTDRPGWGIAVFILLWLLMALNRPAHAQTGQALQFDGSNDYVTVPYNANLNSNVFSVQLWANVPTSGGYFGLVANRINSGPKKGYILYKNAANQWELLFANQGGGWTEMQTSSITPNQWVHLTVTYDGTTVRLYVDGILSVSANTSHAPNPSATMFIGARGDGGTPDFFTYGQLDDVRFWNRALTAAEVLANKDCELKGTQSGLVAYYTFNQGNAGNANAGVTSLTDATGNGNNGTLTNFALTGNTSNWVAPGGAAASCLNCNLFVNRTTANGLGRDAINDVAVVGESIYAASAVGLSISTNGGQAFTTINPTGGSKLAVSRVAVAGSSVYAATPNGLAVSTNGGQSFTTRTTANGLNNNSILSVFVVTGSSPGSHTIYAGAGPVLNTSTNGGQNFTNQTLGSGLSFVKGVFAVGTTVYAIVGNRLSKSTNGGQSFAALSVSFGKAVPNSLFAIGQTVCVGTTDGLYISTDGGQTFARRSTANGLGNNAVRGVFMAVNRVYAATDGGLSVSTDDGQTFTNLGTGFGLGSAAVAAVYAVDNSVYAGTSGGLSLPGFNVQTLLPNGGRLVSTAVNADPGSSLTLRAADTNAGYSWNPGAITTRDFVVTTSGTYAVTAVGSCPGTGSVEVTFLQPQPTTPSSINPSKNGRTAKVVLSFDFSTGKPASAPLTGRLAADNKAEKTLFVKPVFEIKPTNPQGDFDNITLQGLEGVSPRPPRFSVSKRPVPPLPAPYNVKVTVPYTPTSTTYAVKAYDPISKETLALKLFQIKKP